MNEILDKLFEDNNPFQPASGDDLTSRAPDWVQAVIRRFGGRWTPGTDDAEDYAGYIHSLSVDPHELELLLKKFGFDLDSNQDPDKHTGEYAFSTTDDEEGSILWVRYNPGEKELYYYSGEFGW